MSEEIQIENLKEQVKSQNEKIKNLLKELETAEEKLKTLEELVSKNSEVSEDMQRLSGKYHDKILQELTRKGLYYEEIYVLTITGDAQNTEEFKVWEEDYEVYLTIHELKIQKYKNAIEKLDYLGSLVLDNVKIEIPFINRFKQVEYLEIRARNDDLSKLKLNQFKKLKELTINDQKYVKGEEKFSEILKRYSFGFEKTN